MKKGDHSTAAFIPRKAASAATRRRCSPASDGRAADTSAKAPIFIIEPSIWLASCKPEALCSGGSAASLSCVRATDGIVIAVARTRVRVGIKQAKIRTKLPVCFNCAQSGHSGNTSIPMPNRARTMIRDCRLRRRHATPKYSTNSTKAKFIAISGGATGDNSKGIDTPQQATARKSFSEPTTEPSCIFFIN